MSSDTILRTLLIVWAAISLIFGGLMMWRYLVGMREDNILILDPAEASMAAEQRDTALKLERIGGWAKIFGFASLLCLLAAASVWVYRGIIAVG